MSSEQLLSHIDAPKQDPIPFSSEASSTLPQRYGDNRVVVLPRDPRWLFVYWDITSERIHQINLQHHVDIREHGKTVLRVHWTAEQDHLDSFFDVPVDLNAWSTYVSLPQSGVRCWVELGLKKSDHEFIAFFASKRVRTSHGKISSKTDQKWMRVHPSFTHEEWMKLFDKNQPTDASSHTRAGSSEMARMMAQRWEFLISLYQWASSGSAPSSGRVPHE